MRKPVRQTNGRTILARVGAGLAAGLLLLGASQITAMAQSQSCARLESNLRSLNSNRDFRSLERTTATARALRDELQDAESLFIRGGCQEQLRAGQRLSRQCQTLARRITRGRSEFDKLMSSIETGQAVAQQREIALQEIARFGCMARSGSRATIRQRDVDGGNRGGVFDNLFDRLFGDEADIRGPDDDFWYYGGQQTYRTVCVRQCDGYYWPISFATVEQFLTEDAGRCQAEAGNGVVDLYYYANPGGDPEHMMNLYGVPYSQHPNAFRYRQEYDASCAAKPTVNYGRIELASADAGGQSRAVINFGETNFPLPLRDPRRRVEATVVDAIAIALPRRRPNREGDDMAIQAVSPPASETGARYMQFGDKMVRIVGPDTPYARLGEAKS